MKKLGINQGTAWGLAFFLASSFFAFMSFLVKLKANSFKEAQKAELGEAADDHLLSAEDEGEGEGEAHAEEASHEAEAPAEGNPQKKGGHGKEKHTEKASHGSEPVIEGE